MIQYFPELISNYLSYPSVAMIRLCDQGNLFKKEKLILASSWKEKESIMLGSHANKE